MVSALPMQNHPIQLHIGVTTTFTTRGEYPTDAVHTEISTFGHVTRTLSV